jgi:hypothetical protein
MAGIAFLRLRGDAVPMDNSFTPRPGQESHRTACRLCWVRIPPHRPPYRAQGREYLPDLEGQQGPLTPAVSFDDLALGEELQDSRPECSPHSMLQRSPCGCLGDRYSVAP